MLTRTLLITLILVLGHTSLPAQQPEETGVRAAINQYFKGHATGSADEMRKAFLPSAHIEGIRNGTFTSWTAEEYSSRFTGKPAADEVDA